jgi:hypothetical protein
VRSCDGDAGRSLNATGRRNPQHDYGLAILLLGIADRTVPAEQVEALRALVRRFLWASYLERHEPSRAAKEFVAVRAVARTMPEPSATLIEYVTKRDVIHLGSRLLPYIDDYGSDPALSPSRSPEPAAPVFLLHGCDDNVVPAAESQYLGDDLRGHTHVRLLLTDLFSHAEAHQPARTVDVLKVIAFWADLLSQSPTHDKVEPIRSHGRVPHVHQRSPSGLPQILRVPRLGIPTSVIRNVFCSMLPRAPRIWDAGPTSRGRFRAPAKEDAGPIF